MRITEVTRVKCVCCGLTWSSTYVNDEGVCMVCEPEGGAS